VRSSVAQPLDIALERAALGIHDTVNEDVARALRVHAAELGIDYRRFPIVCTGGSAPIHAVGVARKLRAPRVVFPLGAGVMSAFGLLVSSLGHEITRSDLQRLECLDDEAIREHFAPLAEEARGYLGSASFAADELVVRYFIAMRYVGQGHEITVEVSDPSVGDNIVEGIRETYHRRYADVFGLSFSEQLLECVDWKVEIFARPGTNARLHFELPQGEEALRTTRARPVYFAQTGWIEDCPVHDRYALRPGSTISGPALIEEHESTAVLGPGDNAVVDGIGNLLVDINFE
jgi:N-methylhydantoinase A